MWILVLDDWYKKQCAMEAALCQVLQTSAGWLPVLGQAPTQLDAPRVLPAGLAMQQRVLTRGQQARNACEVKLFGVLTAARLRSRSVGHLSAAIRKCRSPISAGVDKGDG